MLLILHANSIYPREKRAIASVTIFDVLVQLRTFMLRAGLTFERFESAAQYSAVGAAIPLGLTGYTQWLEILRVSTTRTCPAEVIQLKTKEKYICSLI